MIKTAKIFWIIFILSLTSWLIFIITNERLFSIPILFFLLWSLIAKLESIEIFPERYISRLIIRKGQIRYRVASDAYFFRSQLDSKQYIKKITKKEMKSISELFGNISKEIHEYLIKTYKANILMPREHIKKFGYHFEFSFA